MERNSTKSGKEKKNDQIALIVTIVVLVVVLVIVVVVFAVLASKRPVVVERPTIVVPPVAPIAPIRNVTGNGSIRNGLSDNGSIRNGVTGNGSIQNAPPTPLLRVDPSKDPNDAVLTNALHTPPVATPVPTLVYPKGKPSEKTEAGELSKKIVEYLTAYPHDATIPQLTAAQKQPGNPAFQYPRFEQLQFQDLDMGLMNGATGQLKKAARSVFYADASQDKGNVSEQIALLQLQAFLGFPPALLAHTYSEYLAWVKRYREVEADTGIQKTPTTVSSVPTLVGFDDVEVEGDAWDQDGVDGAAFEQYLNSMPVQPPMIDEDAIVERPMYPVPMSTLLSACPDTFCRPRDGPVVSSTCQ